MPKVSPLTIQRLLHFKMKEGPKSTCVADVSYDPETENMTISFQQRGTYVYHQVPLDEYVDFQSAGSQGKYFNNYVRDRYSYERIK